jgi:outer membrane protein assembly factor BamA
LLLGCASLLLAQARKPSSPPSGFRLLSIKVTGSKRYTPDQIIAATGLQRGQPATEDDFKAVTQQLGESGAFSNVAYTFQFSPEGIKLELQVVDSDQFVPARFDNFVWLPDRELLQKLSASVPLFQGELPVAGKLADQVSDALQTLAIELKLKGRADYLRSGPADGPIEAFDFSITGQDIRIRKVEFPGAGAAELPVLEAAARPMSGQDYVRPMLRIQAEKNFLPVYLERGYLKAALSNAEPKIVHDGQDGQDQTVVDVAFPVAPGLQYKLSELQLSGYKVFPVEKLRELIHLKSGEVANSVELNKDIETLKGLYGSRGYMATRVVATPETSDADSTVKYVLQLQEGDIYKMGDLDIRGLDSRATERMAAVWKLRPGDTYDSRYPKKFTEDATSLLPGDDWNIVVHETVEDKDKTVDVSLHFEHKR